MGVRDLGWLVLLLELGGIWGVTSVKIRVAIGVPARYGWVGMGRSESGSCGGLMWLRF